MAETQPRWPLEEPTTANESTKAWVDPNNDKQQRGYVCANGSEHQTGKNGTLNEARTNCSALTQEKKPTALR
jgi:hypothetical protein